MLMEPDEYTPQERALTDKAKEPIEQHELDWGNGECFIQRDETYDPANPADPLSIADTSASAAATR